MPTIGESSAYDGNVTDSNAQAKKQKTRKKTTVGRESNKVNASQASVDVYTFTGVLCETLYNVIKSRREVKATTTTTTAVEQPVPTTTEPTSPCSIEDQDEDKLVQDASTACASSSSDDDEYDEESMPMRGEEQEPEKEVEPIQALNESIEIEACLPPEVVQDLVERLQHGKQYTLRIPTTFAMPENSERLVLRVLTWLVQLCERLNLALTLPLESVKFFLQSYQHLNISLSSITSTPLTGTRASSATKLHNFQHYHRHLHHFSKGLINLEPRAADAMRLMIASNLKLSAQDLYTTEGVHKILERWQKAVRGRDMFIVYDDVDSSGTAPITASDLSTDEDDEEDPSQIKQQSSDCTRPAVDQKMVCIQVMPNTKRQIFFCTAYATLIYDGGSFVVPYDSRTPTLDQDLLSLKTGGLGDGEFLILEMLTISGKLKVLDVLLTNVPALQPLPLNYEERITLVSDTLPSLAPSILRLVNRDESLDTRNGSSLSSSSASLCYIEKPIQALDLGDISRTYLRKIPLIGAIVAIQRDLAKVAFMRNDGALEYARITLNLENAMSQIIMMSPMIPLKTAIQMTKASKKCSEESEETKKKKKKQTKKNDTEDNDNDNVECDEDEPEMEAIDSEQLIVCVRYNGALIDVHNLVSEGDVESDVFVLTDVITVEIKDLKQMLPTKWPYPPISSLATYTAKTATPSMIDKQQNSDLMNITKEVLTHNPELVDVIKSLGVLGAYKILKAHVEAQQQNNSRVGSIAPFDSFALYGGGSKRKIDATE